MVLGTIGLDTTQSQTNKNPWNIAKLRAGDEKNVDLYKTKLPFPLHTSFAVGWDSKRLAHVRYFFNFFAAVQKGGCVCVAFKKFKAFVLFPRAFYFCCQSSPAVWGKICCYRILPLPPAATFFLRALGKTRTYISPIVYLALLEHFHRLCPTARCNCLKPPDAMDGFTRHAESAHWSDARMAQQQKTLRNKTKTHTKRIDGAWICKSKAMCVGRSVLRTERCFFFLLHPPPWGKKVAQTNMKVVASVRKSKQRRNKTQSQWQPSHSRALTVTFDKGGKQGVKRNENQNAKEEKTNTFTHFQRLQ